MVQGRLKSRQYETREGEKRTVFEIEVDEVGPSLKYATAKVTRTRAPAVAAATAAAASRAVAASRPATTRGPRRLPREAAPPRAAPRGPVGRTGRRLRRAPLLIHASVEVRRPSKAEPRIPYTPNHLNHSGTSRARKGSTTMAKAVIRKPKKKVCQFCKEKATGVDYKDTTLLRKFISDRGKIRARRVTGNCVQHQRDVAIAVKNAREVALLPYTSTGR